MSLVIVGMFGAILGVAVLAGAFGAIAGVGGGIIIVPVLTTLFGVDIHFAIGASIISVIATSSGAAASYVRENVANIRVGMFLEIATTLGALSGAFVGALLVGPVLFLIFGLILGLSALIMWRKREESLPAPVENDGWSSSLRFSSTYYDPSLKQNVAYNVTGTPLAFGLMYVAGLVSGLLGIGSGALKVPAMDFAMHLPIKVSSATSNFMIGVTAATSAGVYFARGQIDPYLATPVALGVLGGSIIGSHLLLKLKSTRIRQAFLVVLVVLTVEMLLKGFGVNIGG